MYQYKNNIFIIQWYHRFEDKIEQFNMENNQVDRREEVIVLGSETMQMFLV